MKQQTQQKHYHDRRARRRTFHMGDLVLARNFGRGSRWVHGCILQQTGSVSFKVKLEGDVIWHRPQDHFRKRASQDSFPSAEQKHHHDRRARRRTFHMRDLVLARNLGGYMVHGCILQQTDSVSFKVKLEGDVIWHRHQDHFRKRASQDSFPSRHK